jgi:hypothetical protein
VWELLQDLARKPLRVVDGTLPVRIADALPGFHSSPGSAQQQAGPLRVVLHGPADVHVLAAARTAVSLRLTSIGRSEGLWRASGSRNADGFHGQGEPARSHRGCYGPPRGYGTSARSPGEPGIRRRHRTSHSAWSFDGLRTLSRRANI